MSLYVSKGFNGLSDNDLLAFSNNVMDGMVNNGSYFPPPTPDMATFQTGINNFSDSLAAAQKGSLLDKAIKNQKRAALVVLLNQLANYVQLTANGDVLVARASNLDVQQPSSPLPPVTAPSNLKAEDGPNSGDVLFSFDRSASAKSYMYACAQAPLTENTVWENQNGTTSKKILFSGLEAGKLYAFRATALGTNGQSVVSDIIYFMVR